MTITTCAYEQLYVLQGSSDEASSSGSPVDPAGGTGSAASRASKGSGGGVPDKDKVSASWHGSLPIIGREY